MRVVKMGLIDSHKRKYQYYVSSRKTSRVPESPTSVLVRRRVMTNSKLSSVSSLVAIAGFAGVFAASFALTHPAPASAAPVFEIGAGARISDQSQTQMLMSVRFAGFGNRLNDSSVMVLASFSVRAGSWGEPTTQPSGSLIGTAVNPSSDGAPDYLQVTFTPIQFGSLQITPSDGRISISQNSTAVSLFPVQYTRNVAIHQDMNLTIDLVGVNLPIKIVERQLGENELAVFADVAGKFLGYHGIMEEARVQRTFNGAHLVQGEAGIRAFLSLPENLSFSLRLGGSGGWSLGRDSLNDLDSMISTEFFAELRASLTRWFAIFGRIQHLQLIRTSDDTGAAETSGNLGVELRF